MEFWGWEVNLRYTISGSTEKKVIHCTWNTRQKFGCWWNTSSIQFAIRSWNESDAVMVPSREKSWPLWSAICISQSLLDSEASTCGFVGVSLSSRLCVIQVVVKQFKKRLLLQSQTTRVVCLENLKWRNLPPLPSKKQRWICLNHAVIAPSSSSYSNRWSIHPRATAGTVSACLICRNHKACCHWAALPQEEMVTP